MALPLFSLFSNDTAEKAAELANRGLREGYTNLSDLYGQGRGALESNYGKAADVYSNLVGQYQGQFQQNPYAPGVAAYGDVSGAAGVEGLRRGTDLFKNSGQYGVYGVGLNEGLSALARQHAAAGNPLSGNADTDAMKYAADQATKSWGQFQQGLQPYLGASLDYSKNAWNNIGTASQGLANTYTGLGAGLNASYTGQGGAANAMSTDVGKNLAGAELNNYKIGANQLNALIGGAQLAMGNPQGLQSLGQIGSGGGGGASSFAGGGNSGSGGSTYWGQTPGQAFDWSKTPVASLFSGFGGGGGG